MSNNVVVTKGHHTCGQFVNDAVAIKRAPFKSIRDQSKRKDPFLGEGFYFWDDNIEAARWWGKSHYYGKYTILEYDFTLSGDHFLDLVGCRRDIRILLTLREKLKKNGCRDDDLTISKCIALLKEIERKAPGVFPYTVVRAMDVSCRQDRLKFVDDENRRGYMLGNPRIIICYFDRNDIPLQTAKVVK